MGRVALAATEAGAARRGAPSVASSLLLMARQAAPYPLHIIIAELKACYEIRMLPNLSALRIDVQLPDDLTRKIVDELPRFAEVDRLWTTLTVDKGAMVNAFTIRLQNPRFDGATTDDSRINNILDITRGRIKERFPSWRKISVKLDAEYLRIKFREHAIQRGNAGRVDRVQLFRDAFDVLKFFIVQMQIIGEMWVDLDRLELINLEVWRPRSGIGPAGNYFSDGSPRFYKADIVQLRPDTKLGTKRGLLSIADPDSPVDVV